jgi:hypothetical protein
MANHDYVVANGTGASVRSDLNNALAAIVSNNSSSSEPATKYAYQWWADTSSGLLKQRNAANNAWVTIGTLASANLGLVPLNGAGGTPTSLTLTNATGLPVAGGGTGAATFAANGVLFGNGTSAVGVTAVGTATHVLTSNGAGNPPTFQAVSSTSDKISEGNTEAEVVDTGSDGHFKVTTEGTERFRTDSSGRTLIGASAAVSGADANGRVQVSQDIGSNTCILVAENTATSGNLSCIRARLRGSAPNSIFSAFLQCDDSAANRLTLRSNGGLANYSANNANLSDRNTKKDISAAAGTWDRVKEWEIVNYRYKDQPDDADLNLGVIAQQVNESCPEVVTVFQEAKEATETEPAQEERLGVKEQQMHWMAIKALQEAIAKIETLETKVAALEAG